MAKMKEYTTEEMTKQLAESREVVRKFKSAFQGSPERNLKEYREAKKVVAQLLTKMNEK